MAVHKIIRHENPFETVPRALIHDRRLDLAELGALVRLASLPADWNFYMSNVERMLGVKKEKRLTILRKLSELGFYRCTKRKVTTNGENRLGTWTYEHEFCFEPIFASGDNQTEEPSNDEVSTTDGKTGTGEIQQNGNGNKYQKSSDNETVFTRACSTGDGATSAGEPASIQITEPTDTENNNHIVVDDLQIPFVLTAYKSVVASAMQANNLTKEKMKVLLDDLSRLIGSGKVDNPGGWIVKMSALMAQGGYIQTQIIPKKAVSYHESPKDKPHWKKPAGMPSLSSILKSGSQSLQQKGDI